MPKESKPESVKCVAFVLQDDNERALRILDVTGKEIDLTALVPNDYLSAEQNKHLLSLFVLESFRLVFHGGIGTLKLKPYKLPVKAGGKPSAQKL